MTTYNDVLAYLDDCSPSGECSKLRAEHETVCEMLKTEQAMTSLLRQKLQRANDKVEHARMKELQLAAMCDKIHALMGSL